MTIPASPAKIMEKVRIARSSQSFQISDKFHFLIEIRASFDSTSEKGQKNSKIAK